MTSSVSLPPSLNFQLESSGILSGAGDLTVNGEFMAQGAGGPSIITGSPTPQSPLRTPLLAVNGPALMQKPYGQSLQLQPGRNLVFLTFAAALAYRRGISHIVGGMCEADYSGYPDCRDDTIRAMQAALSLGMARKFELHTPLMWIDKAATWRLAHDLGGDGLVDLIREQSHTCYLGERGAQHDWGYGCGECPACSLRAKGWREYVAGRK